LTLASLVIHSDFRSIPCYRFATSKHMKTVCQGILWEAGSQFVGLSSETDGVDQSMKSGISWSGVKRLPAGLPSMRVNRNGTETEIQTISNSPQIRRLTVAGTLVVGLRKTLTHPTKQIYTDGRRTANLHPASNVSIRTSVQELCRKAAS
jgi:hypothetical protein